MLTCYDPDGMIFEIGSDEDMDLIYAKLREVDALQSVLDTRAENQGPSKSKETPNDPRLRTPADPHRAPNSRTLRKKIRSKTSSTCEDVKPF